MLDIQNYFKEDKVTYSEKGIVLYNFDDARKDEFLHNFVPYFRMAYIDDEQLKSDVDAQVWTREDGIKMRLPTNPSLKSGEFGEILMFYILFCFVHKDATIAPVKWRWKENCDMPCHLNDLAFFKCLDHEHPSTTDYISCYEIKTKALAPSPVTSSQINDAINGANKDKTSRLAKLLVYLKTNYSKERDYEKVRIVERFEEAAAASYDKKFGAAIVVDRKYLQKHIKNINPKKLTLAQNENISIYAVPISEMKALYEELYDITPKER